MVGTSATMLAMFGIFGAVLSATGGAQSFITLGQKLMGRTTGGSGKVALVASALFGMISGSVMANVVATGTFTIPMMRKTGYNEEWSAAITSVGATGGQIMPPIMGAGAFLMAQFLGIGYLKVAKAAIIPAFLYYLGPIVAIHYLSSKMGIRGEKSILKIRYHEYLIIFLPLLVFLIFLSRMYSVTVAAFYATIAGLIVSTFFYFLQKSPKEALASSVHTLHEVSKGGAIGIMDAAILLAGAQITISLIALSGIGVKLSDVIISLGRSNLFLCMILSMLVCIILGMGLPTTAAYVLAAAVMVPALTRLHMEPLVSHMFVFFFSAISAITPPVCSAVYMSSSIAKSNWLKTGFLSCFIALPAFIVPFTFVYSKALLLIGSLFDVAFCVLTACIGTFAMGVAVSGYMKKSLHKFSRGILILAGIMMITTSLSYSLAGLVIIAAVFIYYYRTKEVVPVAGGSE